MFRVCMLIVKAIRGLFYSNFWSRTCRARVWRCQVESGKWKVEWSRVWFTYRRFAKRRPIAARTARDRRAGWALIGSRVRYSETINYKIQSVPRGNKRATMLVSSADAILRRIRSLQRKRDIYLKFTLSLLHWTSKAGSLFRTVLYHKSWQLSELNSVSRRGVTMFVARIMRFIRIILVLLCARFNFI